MARPTTLRQNGFTLMEAIIVIVITGIISAAVAIFIQRPVQGYFDTIRRAQLVDIADTALQRISRDVRLALPNSVRVVSSQALEILQVKSAGRYRQDGPGDILDFTSNTDSSFDVLSPGVNVVSGDRIVVFNLGIQGADAYSGTSARAAAAPFGPALIKVSFTPTAVPFPFPSPSARFYVVDTAVSYICAGGNLTRYWNYGILSSQPNPPVGGSSALLANNVSSCSFVYAAGTSQRNALLIMTVSLTLGGETVSLFKQVHVNNVP